MCIQYMHIILCVGEMLCLLNHFSPIKVQRRCKETDTSKCLCNVLQRVTCLPSVLSQGMRPETCHRVALFTFPLDQSSLQERQPPAIEHNTTQDVCLPFVYLCLRNEVGERRFKGRRTLRSLFRGRV